MTAPKSKSAFRIDTRIVVLRKPYVYFPFGFIVASQTAVHANIKLKTSLALCPASANNAEEFANSP